MFRCPLKPKNVNPALCGAHSWRQGRGSKRLDKSIAWGLRAGLVRVGLARLQACALPLNFSGSGGRRGADLRDRPGFRATKGVRLRARPQPLPRLFDRSRELRPEHRQPFKLEARSAFLRHAHLRRVAAADAVRRFFSDFTRSLPMPAVAAAPLILGGFQVLVACGAWLLRQGVFRGSAADGFGSELVGVERNCSRSFVSPSVHVGKQIGGALGIVG